MSDRNDRNLNTEDESSRPENETLASSHLSDDLLNSYLDGEVPVEERVLVQHHLETCAACQTRLRELRATMMLLSGLPAPALRRSFQLSPELAAKPVSVWNRFGAWLMPALPAMRAATIAVAVLFFAVTIRNAVTDTSDSGPISDFSVAIQETEPPTVLAPLEDGRNTAQMKTNQDEIEIAPTDQPGVAPIVAETDSPADEEIGGEESAASNSEETGLAESAPAAEPESAPESGDASLAAGANESAANADDTFADSDSSETAERSSAGSGSAGADGEAAADSANSSLSMIAEASPTTEPSPTASATATATMTATAQPTSTSTAVPTPAPSPTPVQVVDTAGNEDDGDARWTILQIGLGAIFVLLLGSLVVANRYGKSRRQI